MHPYVSLEETFGKGQGEKENFDEDGGLRIAAGSPERSGQEVKGSPSKTKICMQDAAGLVKLAVRFVSKICICINI